MAEFLTVNLTDILKNQKSFDDYTAAEQKKNNTSTSANRNLSRISDWSKELKTRLADNRKLAASERVSDYDVESQFFEDYFYNSHPTWDTGCAKQLISLGEPIKKVMKVLGFNKKSNPILGFITDRYVINNLIKTKLLNTNTFKAIYDAVANKLIANSELLMANDYNIIYCKDFYKKSADEMSKYIKLQAKVLPPQGEEYSAEDMTRNIKTFFYLDAVKEQDGKERKTAIENLSDDIALPNAKSSSTTLNKLAFTQIMLGKAVDDEEDEEAGEPVTEVGDKSDTKTGKQPIKVKALVKKLRAGEQKTVKTRFFAALQYINMHTGNSYVYNALKNDIFKDITISDVISASKAVAGIMKNNELAADEARDFADTVIAMLK